MKKIFLIICCLYSLPIYAVSTALFADGIARVTLKNGYPCVYLNNGKKISNIQYSGQTNPSGVTPTTPDGSSREQCVFFDGGTGMLKYNEVIDIYVNDSGKGIDMDSHITSFCVKKNHQIIQLVSVERGCSDHSWKPEKHYSGLFGRIEQWIDWLFNLNGYTKEVF